MALLSYSWGVYARWFIVTNFSFVKTSKTTSLIVEIEITNHYLQGWLVVEEKIEGRWHIHGTYKKREIFMKQLQSTKHLAYNTT